MTLISSFSRSTMVTCSYPLSALVTMTSSPVRSHRPSSCQTNASSVAFSLFR